MILFIDLLYGIKVSPDGKRLLPPMDTYSHSLDET